MNQTLNKTEGRKRALALLIAQLERNTKPVKGKKPIVGTDVKTSKPIRTEHILLTDKDIKEKKAAINKLEQKLKLYEPLI